MFDENFGVYGVRKIWRQLGREGIHVARCCLIGISVADFIKASGHVHRIDRPETWLQPTAQHHFSLAPRGPSTHELMHLSESPQRFDVFTGGGRRRRFTAGEKAATVEESYAEGTSVCGVARRHGLTPQQLFGWRRLARFGPSRRAEPPLFVPVIVAPDPEVLSNGPSATLEPRRRRRSEGASIELEIDGVVVRVGRDADAGALRAGA